MYRIYYFIVYTHKVPYITLMIMEKKYKTDIPTFTYNSRNTNCYFYLHFFSHFQNWQHQFSKFVVCDTHVCMAAVSRT